MNLLKETSTRVKKRLYLDLDRTLFYTATHELGFVAHDFSFTLEGVKYFVYLRPHLKEFLDFCFSHFEVGVITSATLDYATEILDRLTVNKSDFVSIQTQEDLVEEEMIRTLDNGMRVIVKDFVKVVNHAVLVDDKDYVMQGSHNFLIKASKFEPLGEEDVELMRIMEELKERAV